MPTPAHTDNPPPQGELLAVAQAAGNRLRAETDQDQTAAHTAANQLMQAAATAMAAGRTLTEIAQAEAHGKNTIRQTLRHDALKLVERTANRLRDSQTEHHRAIARATRLGLPMREIAQAAGVTHGTIRAINLRHTNQTTQPPTQPNQPPNPPTQPPNQQPNTQPHQPTPQDTPWNG